MHNGFRQRKARIEHQCIWCKSLIQIGELYWYLTNARNTNFVQKVYCEECIMNENERKNLLRCGELVSKLNDTQLIEISVFTPEFTLETLFDLRGEARTMFEKFGSAETNV